MKTKADSFVLRDDTLRILSCMSPDGCRYFVQSLWAFRSGGIEPDEADNSTEANLVKMVIEEYKQKSEKQIKKNENDTRAPKFVFQKPTQQEVIEYFINEGADSNVEAVKFYNYYESCGWQVGKRSMRDWQAAIRYWMSNVKNNGYGNNSKYERQRADQKQLAYDLARQSAEAIARERSGKSRSNTPTL